MKEFELIILSITNMNKKELSKFAKTIVTYDLVDIYRFLLMLYDKSQDDYRFMINPPNKIYDKFFNRSIFKKYRDVLETNDFDETYYENITINDLFGIDSDDNITPNNFFETEKAKRYIISKYPSPTHYYAKQIAILEKDGGLVDLALVYFKKRYHQELRCEKLMKVGSINNEKIN